MEEKNTTPRPSEGVSRPTRRVTKMSRRRYRRNSGAAIALVIFFAAVIGFSIFMIVRNKKNPPVVEPVTDTETEATTERAPSTESVDIATDTEAPESTNGAVTVEVPTESLHSGDLILVNYKYAYTFPESDVLVNMKDRAEHFSVSTLDTVLQSDALDAFVKLTNDLYTNSGFDGILVVSSFRSVEKQREIYQDRLTRYGSEYAAKYVADPGYSEHHTGLAMDLSVYVGGASYDIETYEDCSWFNENYDRYGYILRYPEHKAGITSINYEGWHYRYVGVPHSLIMDKLDLCLEEYIDYTREHPASNAVIYDSLTGEIKNADAASYERASHEYVIYFAPASDGDTTSIPVYGKPYRVSGNNVDGFIITIG